MDAPHPATFDVLEHALSERCENPSFRAIVWLVCICGCAAAAVAAATALLSLPSLLMTDHTSAHGDGPDYIVGDYWNPVSTLNLAVSRV